MPRDVPPYLLPGPSTAALGPWELLSDDSWEPLPSELPEWDATVSLTIRRTATVDLDRLRAETLIAPETRVGWTVSWISSTSKMRGTAPATTITGTGTRSIEAHLPGDRIGGTLTLHTTLALLGAPTRLRPGAPHLPGSVLLRDTVGVILGSAAAGFPVATIDFAATRLEPHSSWHVETTADLSAPFLGAVLLFINTRDTELVKAITTSRPDRRQESMLDDLDNGVTSLLIELAAHHRADLADTTHWPPGSLGEALQRTLDRAERSGSIHTPTGPHDLPRVRSRLSGVARVLGHGRPFV